MVEEWLEFYFEAGDGIFELEIAEHLWMENSHGANFLPIESDLHTLLAEVAWI